MSGGAERRYQQDQMSNAIQGMARRTGQGKPRSVETQRGAESEAEVTYGETLGLQRPQHARQYCATSFGRQLSSPLTKGLFDLI